MKKNLAVFAAALLILTLIFPVYAESEYGPGSAVISISGADNVGPGDEFTLTAAIAGDYQIHAANISFLYDVNALEIVSGTANSAFTSAVASAGGLAMIDFFTLAAEGRIKVGLVMTTDALTGDYELFDVTFRVKDGVTEGTRVTVEVVQFGYMPVGTTTAADVRNSVIDGDITIAAQTPDGTAPAPTDADGEEPTPTPGTIVVTPNLDEIIGMTPTPDAGNPDDSAPITVTTPDADASESAPVSDESGSSLPNLATKLPEASAAPQETGNGNTLLIVLICAAAAAAIGAVVFIITGRKNK